MTVYSEIDFFLKSFSNDMILLDSSMTAKIPDFGFSVELPKLSHGKTLFTTTCIAGTTHSDISSGRFSDQSDIYCYGVVSYEVDPECMCMISSLPSGSASFKSLITVSLFNKTKLSHNSYSKYAASSNCNAVLCMQQLPHQK